MVLPYFFSMEPWAREAEARIGTPFRSASGHHADAVHCIGLLWQIARALYPSDPRLQRWPETGGGFCRRPDFKTLRIALEPYFATTSSPCHGGIALFSWDNRYGHAAVLSEDHASKKWGMIHAYAPAGRVVAHRLHGPWHGWWQETLIWKSMPIFASPTVGGPSRERDLGL